MQTQDQGPQPPDAQAVDIPATAVLHCPLAGDKLRQVSKCLECPKFGGALQDRFPGAVHLPFTQRYTVPCFARPVSRAMQELEA